MANFLTALGNIGQVLGKAEQTSDAMAERRRKEQMFTQQQELAKLEQANKQQQLQTQQREQQGSGMAWQALQALSGASPPPQGAGQPSVPAQGMPPQGGPPQQGMLPGGMPPQAAPGAPPMGGGQPRPPMPQGQPPGAGGPPMGAGAPPQQPQVNNPALTGPGGIALPPAFDVQQAISYLAKNNPDADSQTLFAALGQTAGMWQQLHPQAKQDYMLMREAMKTETQMDMLKQKMDQQKEMFEQRKDLMRMMENMREDGRNERFSRGQEGQEERLQKREQGIQGRFDKRDQRLRDKQSGQAALKDLSDQKTTIKDQITQLNRQRAAIKQKYAFGQPPANSDDYKKLQQAAQEIDKLSQQVVQIDGQIRKARAGGDQQPAAKPAATEAPAEKSTGEYKSADDVVAAYKAGKLDHDSAAKILRDNGWAE